MLQKKEVQLNHLAYPFSNQSIPLNRYTKKTETPTMEKYVVGLKNSLVRAVRDRERL